MWDDFSRTMIFIVLAPTMAILLQLCTARISNLADNQCSSSYTSNTADDSGNSSQPTYSNCRRRIQHALTGFLFFLLSYILPHSIACLLLSLATTLFYVLHLARSKSKSIQHQYLQHFGPLLREHERNVNTVPGAFWFLLGTTILVLSFTMDIIRTSLLCLSFGDPIASITGMSFGGPKVHFRHGIKSLVGCCSCFITCVLISMFCMGIQYGPGVWILTGFAATLMEVSSGFMGIDDNILIPLGTGAVLSLYVESHGFQNIVLTQ